MARQPKKKATTRAAAKSAGDRSAPAFRRNIYANGMVRIAMAAPRTVPADPAANAREIIRFGREADRKRAAVLLVPELAVTGYAIDDLHLQDAVLSAAEDAVRSIVEESKRLFPVLIVGAPVAVGAAIYNTALVIHRGRILGGAAKS